MVLQISPLSNVKQYLININQLIEQFHQKSSQFNQIFEQLTLVDLERIFYRTSNEEQSDGKGFDLYIIYLIMVQWLIVVFLDK